MSTPPRFNHNYSRNKSAIYNLVSLKKTAKAMRSFTYNQRENEETEEEKAERFKLDIDITKKNIECELQNFTKVVKQQVDNSQDLLIRSYLIHNKKMAQELKTTKQKLEEKDVEIEQQTQIRALKDHLEFFRNQSLIFNEENSSYKEQNKNLRQENETLKAELESQMSILTENKQKMQKIETKINILLNKHNSSIQSPMHMLSLLKSKSTTPNMDHSPLKHDQELRIKLQEIKKDLNTHQEESSKTIQNISQSEHFKPKQLTLIHNQQHLQQQQQKYQSQYQQQPENLDQLLQCLQNLENQSKQEQKVTILSNFIQQMQAKNQQKIQKLNHEILDLRNFIMFKKDMQKSIINQQKEYQDQDIFNDLNENNFQQKFISLWSQCIDDIQNDIMARQLKQQDKLPKKQYTTNISYINNLHLQNADRQLLLEKFFHRNENFIKYVQKTLLNPIKSQQIQHKILSQTPQNYSIIKENKDLSKELQINTDNPRKTQFQNNNIIKKIHHTQLSTENEGSKCTTQTSFLNLHKNTDVSGLIQNDIGSRYVPEKPISRQKLRRKIERSKQLNDFYSSISKSLNKSAIN